MAMSSFFDYQSGQKPATGVFQGSPSIPNSHDWGQSWKYGEDPEVSVEEPGKKKNIWDKMATYGSLFDKARQTDQWQNWYSKQGQGFGGDKFTGGGGQILENLAAVYPQQFNPMYIPGAPGSSGSGSSIGSAIGTGIGLAAAPFTGGASLKAIPFLSGAGGSIGGAFG